MDISELGLFFQRMRHNSILYFGVRERLAQDQGRESTAQHIEITREVINRMIRSYQFKLSPIKIAIDHSHAVTEIFLYLGGERRHLISGFPRALLLDEPRKSKMYPLLSSIDVVLSEIWIFANIS